MAKRGRRGSCGRTVFLDHIELAARRCLAAAPRGKGIACSKAIPRLLKPHGQADKRCRRSGLGGQSIDLHIILISPPHGAAKLAYPMRLCHIAGTLAALFGQCAPDSSRRAQS
jgi:hypothetical protein